MECKLKVCFGQVNKHYLFDCVDILRLQIQIIMVKKVCLPCYLSLIPCNSIVCYNVHDTCPYIYSLDNQISLVSSLNDWMLLVD